MKLIKSLSLLACFSASLFCANAASVLDLQADDEPELIQLYSQNELNKLISENKHLERVVLDECQFTRDIEDRAMVLHYPSYLYLWADMNFNNVCVKGNPAVAVYALQIAADKAMPSALYKLGELYHDGKFVQKDLNLSYKYIYTAASLKHVDARMKLVEFLLEISGQESDYENAYNWLFFTVFSDEKSKIKAESLLKKLSDRMPKSIVKRARIKEYY